MKIRESWLQSFFREPMGELKNLAERLSRTGLEAQVVPILEEPFLGVVVAEVLSVKKHPNADKLNICQVFDGTEEFQIVCGAPNVQKGIKVALAKINAVLPENFKIKKSKIRGEESFGMLCSSRELKLGSGHDGIMELSKELELGVDFLKALNLDELCLEIEITPNRGDCLSAFGLAREVSAVTQTKLLPFEIEAPKGTLPEPSLGHIKDQRCENLSLIQVKLDPKTPTPEWMKSRLLDHGINSKFLAVDLTNYVMLELGQPLHAYDQNKIQGAISVRTATPMERLKLLNGDEITLEKELVIEDQKGKALALAGVMGGMESAVFEDTEQLIFEAAHFTPSAIRGLTRIYKLSSDAAYRFERGVDPALPKKALARLASLVQDFGGEVSSIVSKTVDKEQPQKKVVLQHKTLNHYLGHELTPSKVSSHLMHLGFEFVTESSQEGTMWLVTVPTHRFDISIEVDLVEEVVRLEGMDAIEGKPFSLPVQFHSKNQNQLFSKNLSSIEYWNALGFLELITFSFIKEEDDTLFAPENTEALTLENPMNDSQKVMRRSILPSLCRYAKMTFSYQEEHIRLIECAKTYKKREGVLEEKQTLSLLSMDARPSVWHSSERLSFHELKAHLQSFARTHFTHLDFKPFKDSPSFLHPNQALDIQLHKKSIGFMGLLHPNISKHFSIPLETKLLAFEIDLDALNPYLGLKPIQTKTPLKQPIAKRDLSLVVPNELSFEKLSTTIQKVAGSNLLDCSLFDRYQGDSIAENHTGLSFHLRFQNPTSAINEETLVPLLQKIKDALQELGVVFRS